MSNDTLLNDVKALLRLLPSHSYDSNIANRPMPMAIQCAIVY